MPELDAELAWGLAGSMASQERGLLCGLGVLPMHARSSEELLEVTRNALHRATAEAPVQTWDSDNRRVSTAGEHTPIVANTVMRQVYMQAQRVASSRIPVLIQGETGTGKEVVARMIHESGNRRDHPFVCINCGAIPEHLIESQLFGHERGAFTGAHQQVKGVFESAHGGTVLLDEIGELPLPSQAALLRVIETRRFQRVGSNKEIEVDVRIIAATHRDLHAMAKTSEFRMDLIYRLDAMTLTLPPLRERPDEIEPLARHFMNAAADAGSCAMVGIDEEAMALLRNHSWPGNVRELRNAIDRAVAIAQTDMVVGDDLPERVRDRGSTTSRLSPSDSMSKRVVAPPPSAVATTAPILEDGRCNLREEVERFEAELIMKVLELTGWDRREAAKRLDLPLSTLAYKMKIHGIRRVAYQRKE